MGNNMNCDSCSGNTRNQMDMRRQRNSMYDKYARSQMMSRTQGGCDECGSPRVSDKYEDCSRNRDELRGMPLAMAYVPWHEFECTYEPAQALRAGTIFPELDKPFYGRRGMK